MYARQGRQHTKDTTSGSQIHAPAAQQAPEHLRQPTHPAALIQRAMMAPGALHRADVLQLQRTMGNRAVSRLISQKENPQVRVKSKKTNSLPATLRAGIETLSGLSLDEVKVHYNSVKPAQLQASAYTQGAEIYVGPGQEKHLPHEAWHLVQQAQGRVQSTMQIKGGVQINDDLELEQEADVMGAKAVGYREGEASRRTALPRHSTGHTEASGIDATPQTNERGGGGAAPVIQGQFITDQAIPDDILQAILRYLGQRDVARIAATDKHSQARLKGWPWKNVRKEVFLRNFINHIFSQNVPSVPYQEGPDIPKIIHRFWSGGPLSEKTMDILLDAASKTKGTKWKNRLWYSKSLEKTLGTKIPFEEQKRREKQRELLIKNNYKVKPIEQLLSKETKTLGKWDKKTLKKVVEAAAEPFPNKKFGLKHLSDVARLLYLYYKGGHHFDVDMGLGRMDLTRGYKHNDPLGLIPLFGAVAVTNQDKISPQVKTISPNRPLHLDDPAVSDAAQNVIAAVPQGAQGYLNGMLATRKDNPRVLAALSKMRNVYGEKPSSINNVPGGGFTNEILTYGALQWEEMEKARKDKTNEAPLLTVPPYVLDVAHLTEESDQRT